MPVNLSIKNVPDELAERLRARAAANRRSLQSELMAILEQVSCLPAGLPSNAASAPLQPLPRETGRPRISLEEVARRMRELIPEGTPSSVDMIREMRDGRFGAPE